MKDYFTLDQKIEENRKRIRELFDQYKKIEGSYPLFFAYLGFLGIYSFDIIQYFLFKNYQLFSIYGILLLVHILLFCFCFYLFIKIIWLKSFGNDPLPKDIYNDGYNQAKENYSDGDEKKWEEETKKAYLTGLEEEVELNYSIYDKKKKRLSDLIKIISISFIIYILLIATYKFNVMSDEKQKQKTQEEQKQKNQKTDQNSNKDKDIRIVKRRTNEGSKQDSSKTLLGS